MHISNESLLVILVVGLVAGWLAGKIVRGAGFGLIGDLVIGIIGAFIGDWLLPQIGIHLGTGIISAIVNATGAIRQVVHGEDKIQRRYLVIAAGHPDKPGRIVQVPLK